MIIRRIIIEWDSIQNTRDFQTAILKDYSRPGGEQVLASCGGDMAFVLLCVTTWMQKETR